MATSKLMKNGEPYTLADGDCIVIVKRESGPELSITSQGHEIEFLVDDDYKATSWLIGEHMIWSDLVRMLCGIAGFSAEITEWSKTKLVARVTR